MESRILRDLMRTHNTIIETGVVEKRGKSKKSKYGTADGKSPFGGDDLESKLAELCKKKQPRKVVLEYYNERIAQLIAEDDF